MEFNMKTKDYIPLSVPNFEGNEKRYVNNAVEQQWVSTGGAYITEFENKLKLFLSVGDVAACQSGTSALHLSLIEAGVMPGDVVIVPTLTFIAAVNPVRYRFAEPVFMDADDSLCMDPIKLQHFCEAECVFRDDKLLFHDRQVKAIVVVHVFGNLADMEKIMDIASRYKLRVIEDATEALGSRFSSGRYSGKYAGTIGDFGAFSFNGNKIITTGGGGAVTALNTETVAHMRYLSTQAKNDPLNYLHDEVGYNYRMTNLQAALGVAQMEELPEFIKRKQTNYHLYEKLLEDCNLGRLLGFRDGTESNKWFYSFMLDKNRVKIQLTEIINKMNREGIQTRPIWGLIHEQKPYINSFSYRIEKANQYSKCVLNLPSGTGLEKEDIIRVSACIKKILGGYKV